MRMYQGLLGIVAVISSFGLSAPLPAGDVWKGSWKFEIDSHGPWLGYYDTRGKTVFRFGCGTHYEMDAVYPGAAPEQEHAKASITIANGKTQMDFAGFIDAGPENWPPNTTWFNQADLGYPDQRQMERAGKSLLRSSGLRASADNLGRGQKLRAAAGQGAALAGALPENLLTRRRDKAALRGALLIRRAALAIAVISQDTPSRSLAARVSAEPQTRTGYAACSLRALSKAGATSLMKRSISSFT